MKLITLGVLLFLFSHSINGQKQRMALGKTYKTGIDLTVSYLDGANVKTRIAKAGLKYRYIETLNGKIYIKFLTITINAAVAKGDDNYVNSDNDKIVYFIDEDDLTDSNKLNISSLVTGTLLAPIKIRPEKKIDATNTAPWELSTDITLGQYIGYRISLSKTNPYYLTLPTLTLGTSILSINNSNTTSESDTSTTLGLTWSTGIILDLNGFNIGLIMGKDYAPGKIGKDWIYNEETWFSIGFGINLTSKNKRL